MKMIAIGLVLASMTMAAGCTTTESSRNLNDPSVSGKDLAQQVCSTCHGVDGNSTNPTFPKLAAQQSEYIIAQLKVFRSHDRSDPAGSQYMWGIARHLTDAQITEMAAYFNQQKMIPDQAEHADAGLVAQGKLIFNNGIPSKNTPACAACHGANGEGNSAFPRIAGQHADYIEKQLGVFKDTDGRPDGAVMKVITHDITPSEVRAVAAYLSVAS
jgi:cytochrome c553